MGRGSRVRVRVARQARAAAEGRQSHLRAILGGAPAQNEGAVRRERPVRRDSPDVLANVIIVDVEKRVLLGSLAATEESVPA